MRRFFCWTKPHRRWIPATEQMVMQRLMAEHKGERTMLIVAHRISTLKDADRIVVFDQGRLVEQGRFQELAEDRESRFGSMYVINPGNRDRPRRGDWISHGLNGLNGLNPLNPFNPWLSPD